MDYSIYEQFGDWLSKQPYWVQDAVWRMYNNKLIDDKQIDAYVEMCLSQVQNKKVTYKKIDNNAVCPSETKTKLVIKSIENIKNVNALTENTKLEFGENGVSVIYGLNGAGKSGFMRVFKHVSGNPYADLIQKNVYKTDTDDKPLCDFKLLIDGDEKTISYDLSSDTNDDYLKQCDVFDSRISGAYITSSNSVSYEPFVFSVLKELAHVADRIDHAIKNSIKEIEVESLLRPEMFKDYENASWIDEISHKTIIPQECQSWSKDDDDRIKELKKLLDTANVEKMIKNYKHHELQIKNVKEDLFNRNILNNTKRNDLKKVYEKYLESKKQYEAAEILFSKNASELDKKSISLDEWKNCGN